MATRFKVFAVVVALAAGTSSAAMAQYAVPAPGYPSNPVSGAAVGEFVQAGGSWINDRTHGVQFKASSSKPKSPAGEPTSRRLAGERTAAEVLVLLKGCDVT